MSIASSGALESYTCLGTTDWLTCVASAVVSIYLLFFIATTGMNDRCNYRQTSITIPSSHSTEGLCFMCKIASTSPSTAEGGRERKRMNTRQCSEPIMETEESFLSVSLVCNRSQEQVHDEKSPSCTIRFISYVQQQLQSNHSACITFQALLLCAKRRIEGEDSCPTASRRQLRWLHVLQLPVASPVRITTFILLFVAAFLPVAMSAATPPHKCFQTTEELYAAVDAVLWDYERRSSSTSHTTLTSSTNASTLSTSTNASSSSFPLDENDWPNAKRTFALSTPGISWSSSASVNSPSQASESNTNTTSSALSSAQAAYEIYGASMNAWCVKDLTDFSHVFSAYRNPTAALFFREPVFLWDVSNGVDFRSMFAGCSFFDGANMEQWNVSNAQFMDSMFEKTSTVTQFVGDLSTWNVEQVLSTDRMFAGSKITFGATNDIAKWRLRSIQSAKSMFEGNIRFQFDLCSWGEYFANNDDGAVSVERMFATTSCIYRDQSTADPDLSLSPPGPFCHHCDDASYRDSSNAGIINDDSSGGSKGKGSNMRLLSVCSVTLSLILSSLF